MKIYLAGAITHEPHAKVWRGRAKNMLGDLGFNVIDPLEVDAMTTPDAKLVAMDYSWILQSGAVLAAVETPSWGTAMELAFAKHHGIPVFSWGKRFHSASPWLRHHTTTMHMALHDAVTALEAWGSDHGHI